MPHNTSITLAAARAALDSRKRRSKIWLQPAATSSLPDRRGDKKRCHWAYSPKRHHHRQNGFALKLTPGDYYRSRAQFTSTMLISRCSAYRTTDPAKYAWGRLKHYQNIDAVTQDIMELHNLPEKHRPNAKRQATQLRQCLLQAGEYFDAAKSVSLATRPVLLYYSIMSLALCEVLFKQSGDSRLEKLREQHGCHGLQLAISSTVTPDASLEDAAESLRAKPQTAPDGTARGTFEVWRRSSREYPLCGQYALVSADGSGTTTGYRALMTGPDREPAALPTAGYSLLDVLAGLPQMREYFSVHDCPMQVVRAACSMKQLAANGEGEFSLTVHPAARSLLDTFANQITVAPQGVHLVDVVEGQSGFFIRFPLNQSLEINFPWATSIDSRETWFSCRQEQLNEFGLLYVGLHMAGNFARYYPEKWLAHIETSSPLALAIDKLTEIASDRAPLLTLSELARSLFIADA